MTLATTPQKTRDVRVVPGLPRSDHIAALAHVRALGGDGYLVVLGHDVTERNVVKILNHEMLHIVFQEDPGISDASEALDSSGSSGFSGRSEPSGRSGGRSSPCGDMGYQYLRMPPRDRQRPTNL